MPQEYEMEPIFVSIETTGLRKDDHELIQMTTLCCGTTNVINVKADKEPDEKAMEFNKLDASIGHSRKEFIELYGKCLEDKLTVIHCGKFTLKFILDAGIKIGKFVDVMEEARSKKLPLRLKALAENLGVKGTKCEMLKGIYEALSA